MAAGCEFNCCGVLAIGRCGSCGRAFCRSHAHGYYDCSACEEEARRSYHRAELTRAEPFGIFN